MAGSGIEAVSWLFGQLWPPSVRLPSSGHIVRSQESIPLQFATAHRALAISEILDQILWYVRRSSNLDALNLGLSCRACIETALDQLWKFATIVKLARVFPTHVLIWSKSHKSGKEQITIARMPTSHEFNRLAYYGRRIRTLHMTAEDLHLLGKELVGSLVLSIMSIRENMLIPELRRIQFWGVTAASVPHLHPFIQPRLKSISLWEDGIVHTQSLMDVLDNLRARCPDLQELELHFTTANNEHSDSPPFAVFMESWCTYALSLKDLTALSVLGHALSFATLERLAVSPRLKRITMNNGLDSLADLASTRMALFPVLRTMHAGCDDPDRLALVLDSIASTSMSAISIVAMDCAPCRASALLGILQTIAASASWATLSSLDLTFYRRLERPLVVTAEEDYTVSLNTLRPLFQLRSLKYFTIKAGTVAADDNMLVTIGDSWPELCGLRLSCRHQQVRKIYEGASAVTLGGIEALMAKCPDLSSLNIMLDTSSARTWIPDSSLVHTERRGLSWARMTKVDFQHSRLSSTDIETLATALVQIFPAPWSVNVDFSLGYEDMLEEEAEQDGLEIPAFRAEMAKRKESWDQVASRMEELQSVE